MISYSLFKLLLLASVLIYSCYTDLIHRKIYNNIIVFGLICGLGLGMLSGGWVAAGQWLYGVGLAFVCFLPLYLLKGMAAGDVKLAMFVGGVVGQAAWLPIAGYIYLCGGLIALIYILMQRAGLQLVSNFNQMLFLKMNHLAAKLDLNGSGNGIRSVGKMPYALAIAAGTLIGVMLQREYF